MSTGAIVGSSLVSGGLGLAGGKSGKGRQKIARDTLRWAGEQSLDDIDNLARLQKDNINLLQRLSRKNFKFRPEQDPGFAFVRDEALQAATRKLNQGGFQDSGNILTALQDRAAGLASADAQNQFNRQLATRQANISPLQYLVNMGAQASQNMANIRQQTASNLANAYMGAAQSAQQGNQFALQSVNNAVQGAISNSLLQDLIKQRQQPQVPSTMLQY